MRCRRCGTEIGERRTAPVLVECARCGVRRRRYGAEPFAKYVVEVACPRKAGPGRDRAWRRVPEGCMLVDLEETG